MDYVLDNIIGLVLGSFSIVQENVLALRRYMLMYLDVRYRDVCNLQMVQLKNASVCESASVLNMRDVERDRSKANSKTVTIGASRGRI